MEAGRFAASAPAALIVPPGMRHATAATSRVERGCIHFRWYGETMPDTHWVFDDDPAENFRPEKIAGIPDFGKEFPWFAPHLPAEARALAHRFFFRSGATAAEMLDRQGILFSLLGSILDAVQPKGDNGFSSSRRLLTAKHRIERDFADPSLSVRKIARDCGVTSTHLTRLFRLGTGVSVQRYIRQLKMEKAKALLRGNASLTIKEIGDLAGFADANYFSRVFKAETGETPGVFRSAEKEV